MQGTWFEPIYTKYKYCTVPSRYLLHHSFTDKNKSVKRNVAVDLETLTRVLDVHVIHRGEESFHEYLRSATNFFTKIV